MIFEKIASILAEQFGIEQDEITMDTSFEDLGADSLDVVELTMALEEEFGIGEMEEEDLSGISTVSDPGPLCERQAGGLNREWAEAPLQSGASAFEERGTRMEALEEKLGYQFEQPALLENALTHSSYANESRDREMQSNERLEFLGDSVLGMVVADYLYRAHPDLPEGDLTRTRAALVCEGSLVEVAQQLGLGAYLKLGKGEDAGGGRTRPSILADAVEGRAGRSVPGWGHRLRPQDHPPVHPGPGGGKRGQPGL